ncbi:hypothetical protein UP09_32330 [Bradyrhizobium sp. LTSP885]|uniref:hypothetical protein n=1 Tax=Bradyrhizobium sp. LTSP885 TaxID=1619232 RepID=UPI0005C8A134|nr:hypothetical protein [Bradyrhizobium sp. LTSP885]KJC35865.1 hypothetical protein UP09_32330 [Bradyrhizobium sp. LTSP885]
MAKTYSIFGAGASGLYTAWRLLDGKTAGEGGKAKQLAQGDTLELYDWGKYDFSKEYPGSRAAGARVCTWHYKDDKSSSYLELGGMRYSDWNGDNSGTAGGHRVVTTVIKQLGLDQYAVPFNTSSNPLYYLRTKNMYLASITSANPAPYHVDHYGADDSPDTGFTTVELLAGTAKNLPQTRAAWCEFYQDGSIAVDVPQSSVYQKGQLFKDIGYWNLMFDQLGSEGFGYVSDGNGYTSNVINWNSAVALQANNEFTPGTEYKTLTTGYSSIFNALFDAIVRLAKAKGVTFDYHPDTRLHSILKVGDGISYAVATRKSPNKKAATRTTNAAWLAMPRYAIDLVAQATRYEDHQGLDVLNHEKVQLYLESAIMQPSYKVGMFFDQEWWTDTTNSALQYPAPILSYEVTLRVLDALAKAGFPAAYVAAMKNSAVIVETPYASASDFIHAVEHAIQERLTVKQEEQLLAAAKRNSIGPSVTDTPIRQVVYFGNNARGEGQKPVFGLLASYDDEMYTSFWQDLELGPDRERKIPISDDMQPLDGPREAPPIMVKMLRAQLAAVHFGPQSDYTAVPEPLETRYMDWSLPPFNAGYHAYASHYNVCDVQQKIRKPSQLIDGADADIFIVGEAYSNDQAWVEGAFCTAESVLNDFFGVAPIIDNANYPFICPSRTK